MISVWLLTLGEILTYDKAIDVLGAVDVSVFASMMEHITGGDLGSVIRLLDDIVMKGREIQAFVTDFISYLRDLLLISAEGSTEADIADVLGVSSDTYEQMKMMTRKVDTESLMRYIRIFSELSSEIRYSSQKKTLTEIAIVRLLHPEMQDDAASTRQAGHYRRKTGSYRARRDKAGSGMRQRACRNRKEEAPAGALA